MKEDIPGINTLHCSAEKLAEFLDQTQWVADFAWPELLCIARHMRAYEITASAVLFHEGDTDQYMGIIVKGQVDIFKSDLQHGFNKIATLNKSQSLGEMGLIDGQPRSAKAVAKQEVLLLVLKKEDIHLLEKEHPHIAFKLSWKICQMLSQRLRMTSGQLVDYLS